MVVRVSGVVRDRESGAPLVGASVSLDGNSTRTGIDGVFVFDVPAGRYVLKVRMWGYSPYTEEIVVDRDTALSIELVSLRL